MPSPIKFTPQDIQPIMESIVQFANSIDTFETLLLGIQHMTNPYQGNFFEVLVNDGVKRQDKKYHAKKHFQVSTGINASMLKSMLVKPNFIKETPIPNCQHIGVDFWGVRVFLFPNDKVRSKECCAFYNQNLIFKSNIKTDKPLQEYLLAHPEVLTELAKKVAWSVPYYSKNPTIYQKDMDAFLLNMEKINKSHHARMVLNLPFMQVMERLRQFLFDTLITHHASQIAPTIEGAKQVLKSDKNKIFTVAEQLGYIPDAQKMIAYHSLRDKLAHPDSMKHIGGPRLPDNCTQIKEDFESVLTSLLHGQNIKILSIDTEKTPIPQETLMQTSVGDMLDNIDAYHLIEQLDFASNLLKIYTLPTRPNGKVVSGEKKLKALNAQGVLSEDDVDVLGEVTQTRNDFAHGNVSSVPSEALQKSNHDVQVVLQSIVTYQRERHQRSR